MATRRQFIKTGLGGGTCLFLPARSASVPAWPGFPSRVLDPTNNRQVRHRARRPASHALGREGRGRARRSLHDRRSTVSPADPASRSAGHDGLGIRLGRASGHASPTRRAPSRHRVGRPVRVTWVNQLVDRQGNYLPHLLPVDPTLHWANPPGGIAGGTTRPTFTSTPGPYTGPVPIVTHLHGGHSTRGERRLPRGVVSCRARSQHPRRLRTGGHLL